MDDLDYADDLALLSYTRHQMQEKTSTVADTSTRLGLEIHKGKSKVLKVNMVTVDEVESFTFLGSIEYNTRGREADVRACIGESSFPTAEECLKIIIPWQHLLNQDLQHHREPCIGLWS